MEKKHKRIRRFVSSTPRRVSGRNAPFMTMMGTVGNLMTGNVSRTASKFSQQIRMMVVLNKIVATQSMVRCDQELKEAPNDRSCNYGYAFAWDSPTAITASHHLIARSDEKSIPFEIPDGMKRAETVAFDKLGVLQPHGLWPVPKNSPLGTKGKPKVECVEVKLLHYLLTNLSPDSKFSIVLFTERHPCASCCAVIDNYLKNRTNDLMTVVFGFGFERNKVKNLVTSPANRLAKQRYRSSMRIKHLGRLKFLLFRDK